MKIVYSSKHVWIVFLLLCVCLTTRAQEEGQLYRAAYRMMFKQQVDSTFLYLDSLASAFGHEDIDLCSDLIVNESFRPLHQDARWEMLMKKLLNNKKEVEDTLRLECPTKMESFGSVAAEAKYYRLMADVDVTNKRLKVEGDVTLDFKGQPHIDFALWKYTDIADVSVKNHPIKYEFFPDSSLLWMNQAGRLRIYSGQKENVKVHVAYTAHLDSLDTWMAACDSNFVQLSFYMAWFPYHSNSNRFKGEVGLTIDDRFKVTGSGLISKRGQRWQMSQPWEGFDLEWIASPQLKKRKVRSRGKEIEIDYIQFPAEDLDSLSTCCRDVFDFYCDLYQVKPNVKQLKVVLLPDGEGAISRRNFIVTNARYYNEYLYRLMSHEIGHFWWQYAPTDNWLDWLNESFAEYSSLRAIQHRYGQAVFEDYIRSYRVRTAKVCPIYRMDREAPAAFYTFYYKGALLLYDLEQAAGEASFSRFMRTVAKKKVSNHQQFLRIVRETLGSRWVEWIEQRLNE